MARLAVPGDNQDQVLLLSRRRCCICFGLHRDLSVKQGQIAHLDHDNANSDQDNLAFLCLPHHDQYDGKTSQSKALRQSEVKQFRKELYERIAAGLPDEPNRKQTTPLLAPESKAKSNIKFVEARTADVYHSDDTVFHETQRGLGDFKVTIVCFRNEGIEGRSIPSINVRAHVIYRDAAGQEITDMPSGVWLEEYKGHTDFTLGTKKCLIVFLLTNQETLKKLWKEAYTHHQSWTSGMPSYRVKDEVIRPRVATIEIQLLSEFTDICVLKKVFKVEKYEDGGVPNLTILPPQELMSQVGGSSRDISLPTRVTEITLEADYFNRDSQSVTLACQSVLELPGKYISDTSSDGRVMRSEIEPPALLAVGIDTRAVEALDWNPTRLLFKDATAGKSRGFSGHVCETLEPNILKFAMPGRLNVAAPDDARKRLDLDDLADAMLSLARQIKEKNRDVNGFSESLFCRELNETPERIARAMDVLNVRGRAKRTAVTGTWLLFP